MTWTTGLHIACFLDRFERRYALLPGSNLAVNGDGTITDSISFLDAAHVVQRLAWRMPYHGWIEARYQGEERGNRIGPLLITFRDYEIGTHRSHASADCFSTIYDLPARMPVLATDPLLAGMLQAMAEDRSAINGLIDFLLEQGDERGEEVKYLWYAERQQPVSEEIRLQEIRETFPETWDGIRKRKRKGIDLSLGRAAAAVDLWH